MDGNIMGFSPNDKFSFDIQRFTGDGGDQQQNSEPKEVSTADSLETAISSGGIIKLTGDITLSEALTISKNTTLDLNGYTIKSTLSSAGQAIKVTGGTFTLRDTSANANGKITSNSDSIKSGGSTAHNTIFISGGKFVMESGTVEITNSSIASRAVNAVFDTAPSGDDLQVEIKGGTILGTYIGLSVGTNAKAAVTGSNTTIATKNLSASVANGDAFGICVWGSSKVTVGTEGDTSGPTITAVAADNNTKAEGIAISGNGTNDKNNKETTIEILSGSLSATGGAYNNLGIYNPSVDSTLTIKGGTITGGDSTHGGTGVEIRAASSVNITGGEIIGAGSYDSSLLSSSNGSGSTTRGVGISVAQHTTVQKIEVNIGGDAKVSGAVALAVTNPHNFNNTGGKYNNTTIEEVAVNVTGGEFEGTDASVFYQDSRSELDLTGGDFKGEVISGYDSATSTGITTITINKNEKPTNDAFKEKYTDNHKKETITDDKETNAKVKIAGGTYDNDSVEKYTTSNDNSDSKMVYNSQTGTYGVVNKLGAWSAVDGHEDQYKFLIASGSDTITLQTATIASDISSSVGYLTSDSLYRVIGVWDDNAKVTAGSFNSNSNNTLTAKYSWLKFKTGDANDVTITPQVAGVKIIGTDIIGGTATKLTVESLTGADTSVAAVTVSGADNSLSSIFSNKGDDSIVAGARATTIDGGDGDDIIRGSAYADSLKGGGGNDKFYYSGGADTIADFGNGNDEVVLDSDSGLTPITDGTKITSNTNSFTLNFGKGNTLTFQKGDAANLPTVSVASSQHYVYTKDWVMEEGKSVTLASAVKEYTITNDVMTVDGSAAAGNLTITDSDNGNNNYVTFGGEGKNTFNYKLGNDVILGYNYDNGDGDVVSLAGTDLTAPIDFTKATYDGSNFKINLDSGTGASKTLTFKGAANVALLQTSSNETDTYTYKAIAANKLYSIAQEGKGISLGAGYTSTQYNGTSTDYATIDAANVTQKIRIRGNDKANYIVGGSSGGVLEGNDEDDTLNGSGATDSLTLNGGAGDDLLIGGTGYNYFVYSEGSDSISGYHNADVINVTGRAVSFADVAVSVVGDGEEKDLLIKFDNDNQLSIAGGASFSNPISITSGRNNYAFTKDYFALNGKSITLTADYSITEKDAAAGAPKLFNGLATDNTTYQTINAGLVTGDISIVGNTLDNYIVGGLSGNSLAGGDGDDTLVGGTTADKTNLFYYTAGKDVIENFGASKDKLAIEDTRVEKIANGKLTNSKLTFTVDKNNSLTFKFGDNAPFESVSLQSNAYLTKDGVVSVQSGATAKTLKLFASAKGKIDLKDELYSLSADSAISTVDASTVKSQSVTLVGGTQGGLFKYYNGNKQRDGFEYGGGNVTISGYEGGRDRIDLGDASLTKFEITGSGDNQDVKLTIGTNTISIASAAGEEVLLRDPTKGNGYKKMVFAATGVVQNKAKNPTMATVSTGVTSYSFADSNHNAQTVKKIYVTDVAAGASIRAGDKYNTVIDASKATYAVSLSGGAKNDKLIGSTVDADDLFVYTGGKDVIQNFGGSDQISLAADFKTSLDTGKVKITAAKKSIKFKFDNKNVLTIKSNATMSGELTINDDKNIYFKNAIGKGKSVTLTSAFSGTFKTQDSNRTALPTAATVDGGNVEKNLTFKGSSDAETLIGGSNKNRKTMFRGGGGADSLVGGDSKDTFFYAKGNTGDATIANFDFANDKIKVSSGIISKIENSGSAIKFSMTNGKSTDAAVGSFNVDTSNADGKKVAIKANNTYYWFVEKSDTYYSASTGDTLAEGTLITTENRLKSAPSGDYAVIDLNYSTNLAKNDIVAVKATPTKPTTTTT